MINIILCGGSGTRLWPVSRSLMPKQFVKLFEDRSLFQLAVERNMAVSDKRLIVSNKEHFFMAKDQLEELQTPDYEFLLEPVGRNTAPAIALACMSLDEDEVVLVSAADHFIKDNTKYHKAVNRALELATEDNLVTFGITPEYAETGYGYIKVQGEDVQGFFEKPNAQQAEKYLSSSEYLWNSGMFCFKVKVFLDELKKFSPDIYLKSKQAYKNANKAGQVGISRNDMLEIPSDSVDCAIMEKTSKAKVVAAEIGWSDLGSFESLHKKIPTDTNGNTRGEELYTIDAENNFVFSHQKTVALVGVKNLIIADTGDALLISQKGRSQDIKGIVDELKVRKSNLHEKHLTTHRPWGVYRILDEGDGYKVKRIVVKAGKRISLQKHEHRSEHWNVVRGTAKVTKGEETFILHENESSYIPVGELHRLENPKSEDLVIIETQVGSYLEEDDIIRLEDDYEREKAGK